MDNVSSSPPPPEEVGHPPETWYIYNGQQYPFNVLGPFEATFYATPAGIDAFLDEMLTVQFVASADLTPTELTVTDIGPADDGDRWYEATASLRQLCRFMLNDLEASQMFLGCLNVTYDESTDLLTGVVIANGNEEYPFEIALCSLPLD